jgi:hypothetical protein
VLTLQTVAGVDEIKALRWTLKGLLRRHGMSCVDLREGSTMAHLPRCECKQILDPVWLKQQIEAGHEIHTYVLVCTTCGGLWNDKATDRLIEHVMKAEATS